MDTPALWKLLGDGQLWIICGVGFALGALGGFIQAIGAEPPIELRKEWWKRVLIGAVAAVAVLYVNEPETAIELIGGSLVAGFAGQALLTALEARGRLATAEERIVETRRELHARADEIVDAKVEIKATTRERDTAVEAAHILLGDQAAVASAPARVDAARAMLGVIRRPVVPPG